MGILRLLPRSRDKTLKSYTLLIICWAEYSEKTTAQRQCILPLVQYEFYTAGSQKQMNLAIVEFQAISAPAAAYPVVESELTYTQGEHLITDAPTSRFWFMPLRLLRRCRSEFRCGSRGKGTCLDLYGHMRESPVEGEENESNDPSPREDAFDFINDAQLNVQVGELEVDHLLVDECDEGIRVGSASYSD